MFGAQHFRERAPNELKVRKHMRRSDQLMCEKSCACVRLCVCVCLFTRPIPGTVAIYVLVLGGWFLFYSRNVWRITNGRARTRKLQNCIFRNSVAVVVCGIVVGDQMNGDHHNQNTHTQKKLTSKTHTCV